jgi:prepilin peptidase CpaA
MVFVIVSDVRHRQISNRLNAAVALGAPLFWWASGLSLSDLGWQLGCALLTFVIATGLWMLRVHGGGDVKLLTALSLWIKPALFLKLIVWMSLFGGALCFGILVVRVFQRRRVGIYVPYGPAIALATLLIIGTNYLPSTATAVLG